MVYLFALIVTIIFIIVATSRYRLHPILALLIAAFGYGYATGANTNELVASVTTGFGATTGSIGIVIIAGSIIGVFFERSGGAVSLAKAIIDKLGPRHIPASMSCVGFLVSMPVYCDTAFVILSSLNKALSKRAGVSIAGGAIALSLGLYATHTMVPPTPGPVAAAAILEADLGYVISVGVVVAIITTFVGWLFAVKVAARFDLKMDSIDSEYTEIKNPPNVIIALLPIIMPLVLIVARSIAQLPDSPMGGGYFTDLAIALGNPIFALSVGVALSFFLPRNSGEASNWIGDAINTCASVILITGAGGAFGKVLQASGVATRLAHLVENFELGILLPFLIAAVIKTAQGSSTVAIVTTAGLLAPLLPEIGLDSEVARALVVVAIGAGAMVVSHANDSYFWVVTQFSGMDVKTGYQLHSVGTLLQGIVAAGVVWGIWKVLSG